MNTDYGKTLSTTGSNVENVNNSMVEGLHFELQGNYYGLLPNENDETQGSGYPSRSPTSGEL